MRSINLPCPRPPNRLAELWPRGALRSGPDCLWRTGRDTHVHLHAEMVRWEPDEGAVERDRVARIAHDRNGDKANLADAADRGVEIDPATARQIDWRPGMGRPRAEPLVSSFGSSSETARYPDANRAAKPSERAASIISMAKSRQLPWRSRSVSTGSWILFASRRL